MASSHGLLKSCVILQLLGVIGWVVVIVTGIKVILVCVGRQVDVLDSVLG